MGRQGDARLIRRGGWRSTVWRRVGLLLAILDLVVGAVSAPAAVAGDRLLRPPAPGPGSARTPAFVTETDEAAPYTDCAWAAAAMLLEHWVGVRPDREALRRASGDTAGGSTYRDVARGAAALLGIDLRYSPAGGDPVDFEALLGRLARGGGAVVAGHYRDLPEQLTRWDRAFAASDDDLHSVYVEQYDADRGVVFWMDPLGRGTYAGEWIPVDVLEDFALARDDGILYAVVTPEPAPGQAAEQAGAPRPAVRAVAASPRLEPAEPGPGDVVSITLDLTSISSFFDLGATRLVATWTPVHLVEAPLIEPDTGTAVSPAVALPPLADDPAAGSGESAAPVAGPPAGTTEQVAGAGGSAPNTRETIVAGGRPSPAGTPPSALPPGTAGGAAVETTARGLFVASVAVSLSGSIRAPAAPGLYRLRLALDGSGAGLGGLRVPRLVVAVRGDRAALISAPAEASAEAGGPIRASVTVTNSGRVDWQPSPQGVPGTVGLAFSTRLVATWVDGDGAHVPAGAIALVAKVGEAVELDLGQVAAPPLAGTYELRLEVADPVGKLTLAGSPPGRVLVRVTPSPQSWPGVE